MCQHTNAVFKVMVAPVTHGAAVFSTPEDCVDMLMQVHCILHMKADHVEVGSFEGKAAGLCPRGLQPAI